MDRTSAEVRAEVEAQPRLQPGEAGWWKVYGARGMDIRPGDFVLTTDDPDGFYVQDTYVFTTTGIRIGIVVDGQHQSIGCACPLVLLRRSDRATLSDRIR